MRRGLTFFVLAVALVIVAGAMTLCGSLQRDAAARSANRIDASTRLLTGMIDQETGLRGFLIAGREEFLTPLTQGRVATGRARTELGRDLGGDHVARALLDEHGRLQARWYGLAVVQIRRARRDRDYRGTLAETRDRKALMDRMRAVDARLHGRLVWIGDREQAVASREAAAIIVGLTLLIGVGVVILITAENRRRRRTFQREIDYRVTQREFTDAIQDAGSEREAHDLLKRHLELRLPGAAATVLVVNNSENRLRASTPVPRDGALAAALEHAAPSACQAVRAGREQRTRHGQPEKLVTCGLCGHDGLSACQPLLVGGNVIGSVLVEHEAPLEDDAERRISESVSQAAPVLANLRNLAIAERKAATDSLTGLPNRRALADAIKLLSAQALHADQPLAAVSIDLDHFKSVNDEYGHDMGDAVLAQVAAAINSVTRGRDVAGRNGGEEFLVLAPATDVAGAMTLAENLRQAIAREVIPGLPRSLTASLGVAVLPTHAADPDNLVRLSDRALYAAKSGGRNRVEVIGCTEQGHDGPAILPAA